MIDRAHDLPITRQAEALNISRGSVYYLPRLVPKADLAIFKRLDRLHLRSSPSPEVWMLRGLLVAEGCKISGPPSCEDADAADKDEGAVSPSAHDEARAGTQDLSVSAARRRDHTAKPGVGDGHHLHFPMAHGFVYLTVMVLDWFSRRVLSSRVSIRDGGGILRRGA